MTKFNASYPLYRATQFNTSYPGALFTSTDLGCMYCPTFPMGTGNTMTAWYVGTMAGSTSGGFGRTLSYNVAGGFEMMATGSTTTVKCYRGTFPTGLVSSAASVYPAGHRFIYTIKSNGDLTIYIDNVATGGLTISGNFTNNGTLLFGGEAGASGGGFWTGIASEWGISADYSDATAAAALDLYLKNKWGL
jgi:hypothetical protein